MPSFPLYFSSSSAFLQFFVRQSSHLSCGQSRLRQSHCFCVSAYSCILLFLPTKQASVPVSSLSRFILLLSTLFTPDILLIQLFSPTCSLHCCRSHRATISKSYEPAGTTHEFGAFQPSGNRSIITSSVLFAHILSCLYSASHRHMPIIVYISTQVRQIRHLLSFIPA